jgi:ribosomal protein L21
MTALEVLNLKRIVLLPSRLHFSQPKALVPSENYRVIIATKIHANKVIRLLERHKEHVHKKRGHKKETCTAFRGRC